MVGGETGEEKMGRKLLGILLVLSIAGVAGLACETMEATVTPDIQATVEGAVAATATAQAGLQATVGTAVQATITAVPSPTPPPDVETMSEEELAALVDEAVTEAVEATEQSSTAATEAAADDVVTPEEVDELAIYVSDAEAAIEYAAELAAIYDDLYGELATETVALLTDVEDDLALLAESAAAMTELLVDMETSLEQGVEITEDLSDPGSAPKTRRIRKVWTDLTPSDILARIKGPNDLTFRDIRRAYAMNPRDLRMKILLHYHITFPLSNLLLLLLGLPFVLRPESRSHYLGLTLALLICGGYFVLDVIMRDLGAKGQIHPVLAAWFSSIFCGGVGIYLYDGIRT